MKNRELFNRTIDILVKAYQNDTLNYTDCARCAVGNIVSHNMGYKYISLNKWQTKDGNIIMPSWQCGIGFGTGVARETQVKAAILEAEQTGYSRKNLAEIEAAFAFGTSIDKWDRSVDHNFNGLMSVVDTLMQIHEANTDEVTEAKSLFVKV